MDAVWVALIVAVIGPALLSWLTGRQRRAERREDYERQDAVAAKVEEAAQAAADAAASTGEQLQQIHTLVNSNMTAEMQARLVATQGQLVLMRRVLELNEEAGQRPTQDELAAIDAIILLVTELEAALADRLEKTVAAELDAGGLP